MKKIILMIMVVFGFLSSCGTKKKCDIVAESIKNSKQLKDDMYKIYGPTVMSDPLVVQKIKELNAEIKKSEDWYYNKCGIWGFY
jgi:hypothetical protein